MPVNARGLTLVEVVVATAIVLVTCVAVSAVIAMAAHAGARSNRALVADGVLQCEAARLRSLPFFSPLPADWPVSRTLPAPSAVGELFPHADETLNGETPGCVASGDLAGAFVSSVVVDDAEVQRTTWMARCEQGGWRLLSAADVAGWRGWSGEAMPGEALVITLEVAAGPAPASPSGTGGTSRTRTQTLVLTPEGGLRAVDPEALVGLDGEAAP